jgi:predicted nucleic acid-binding protein
VIPVLVIAEVVYLVGERLGSRAEARFLSDLASGEFAVEAVHPADWERIAELVAQYGDMRLGTVDASIVAAAERLGITRIATLDRRHFTVVRPRHVAAFELPLLD